MAASDVLNYFAQPIDSELANNILTINGGMTMTNTEGSINQDQIISTVLAGGGGNVVGSGTSVAGTFPVYSDITGKNISPSAIALTNNTLIGVLAGALANISAGTNITIAGGEISATSVGSVSVNVQVINDTGAFVYTPTAGMAFVIVELQGAGGGAGGTPTSTSSTTAAISNSGAGGGYAKFLLTAAEVGASLSGSVGAGGAGGSNTGGNGSAGGDTTLATVSPWAATGGTGGSGGVLLTDTGVESGPVAFGGYVTTGTGTLIYSVTGGYGSVGMFISPSILLIPAGGGSALTQPGFQNIVAGNSGGAFAGAGTGYGSGAGGTSNSGNNSGVGGQSGDNGVAIFTEIIIS